MNILFIVIALLALLLISTRKKEKYNQGALIQLFAKGPQDTYLTGDAWKYIPWYYGSYPYYSYGRYWPWNIPTRTRYGYWY